MIRKSIVEVCPRPIVKEKLRFATPRGLRLSGRGGKWLLLATALISGQVFADNCVADASGSWNSAGNWTSCGGGIPGVNDTARIPNGFTITTNSNVNTTVAAVTVDAGGTLNVDRTNFTVTGTTSISGTLSHTNSGRTPIFIGQVTINSGGQWTNPSNEQVFFRGGLINNGSWSSGAGAQNFEGNNQVIGGANPITFSGNVVVSGISLTNVNTNTVRINGQLNGSSGGSTWINGVNSTLEYADDATPMSTGSLNASANPNTVNYLRNGNQNVKDTTYHNLILGGGGTKELPGLTVNGNFSTAGSANTDANGNLTVLGNIQLSGGDFEANGFTHTVRGNFSNSASFTAESSNFVFNGSVSQKISGTTSPDFNNLTIANTSVPVSVESNIRVDGNLSVNAGASLSPTPTSIISGSGTLTGSGTALVTKSGSASDFTSQYTITNKSLSNLTVAYVGSAAQTISALTYGNLTVNNAGGASLVNTTTVGGTLMLTNGALHVGTRILNLNGPAIAGTPTNLTATSDSTLSFGGNSTGVSLPSSVTQLDTLEVNNANGITLNGNVTVDNRLTLVNGAVTTGANTLTASNNCPASATRSSGYVDGRLRLKFAAGSNTCAFYLGSGTAYAPVTVSTPVFSLGGMLTAYTTGAEHPDIATSSIDATQDVNRYWTLTDDTINASSYGVTLGFVNGDVDVGASTADFVLGRFENGAWTSPTTNTASANATGSASVAGPLNNVSFASGETIFSCSVPPGMPSTMTCVCDNFGRAALNPSTIYGGNWSVSTSSGSFGLPRIVNGYLRLTDNSNDVATAATMPGTFPAAGNLITVDFKHYAYNGSGADGIALTLSDAALSPVPGAYGGSLGYAQKNNASCASPPCNGFVGGWIGVGIDEYGNYSAEAEGRVGGSGFRADSVAVRGSGTGLAGYPYLAGTGTLGPGIDSAGSGSPAPGHAYRVMVDARCYERNTADGDITCNNPSLQKRTRVSVFRDTSGLGNFTSGNRIVDFDAYVANSTQANVPQNWKLSFTGSTGGITNIHQIQGIKVCAQTITPPAGYRIEVDNLTPSTCATQGGSSGSPVVTITALDTNGNVVGDYNKTVTLSALLTTSGAASSATWSKAVAAGTLSGNQYTFVAADNGVAKFYLTNASSQSVSITVSESGGTIASSYASPVVFSGASFNITNLDPLVDPAEKLIGGGLVAGRNHLMRITRTTGCAVNTAYNGSKNLDGWYTPATADHPNGASAPQICAANAGTCLPTTGSCQTLSIAPPTVDASSNFLPALNFVNGVADFCLKTSDVGKYSISLRDDSATPVSGSSGTLTARPFAIAVTNVKRGAQNNPADSSASGVLFGNAGQNFQATVGGYLWNGAADGNNDGLPDASATQANVVAAGVVPRYADTVVLSADSSFNPHVGELTGGSVAITAGSNTQLSLAYSEVGSFSMGAAPSSGYLNSGVNLSSRVVIFANPSSPNRTAVVGRFKPHNFTIANPWIVNRSGSACTPDSVFTYMGEPMRVGFTLEARNLGGAITKNYSGAWAKLSPTDWIPHNVANSVGLWMKATNIAMSPGTCSAVFGTAAGANTSFACTSDVTLPPAPKARAAGPRITMSGAGPTVPLWTDGIGLFSADVAFQRADAPDGPYEGLNIGVAPRDMDGTVLPSFNLDADNSGSNERASLGTTHVRFGQLRLFNGIGSAKLSLPIGMETQFWNGSSFQTNALDSCTSLKAFNMALTQYSGGINSTNMPLGNIIVGGAFNAGIGEIRLNRPTPTPAEKGSVNICVDLDVIGGSDAAPDPICQVEGPARMPWLMGRWSAPAVYDDDPMSRASFGIYRGGPVIYMREVY